MPPGDTIDVTIAGVASKTTYAGAGTSVAGWLLSSEFVALLGIALSLGGFFLNVWFRRREERRQLETDRLEEERRRELHAARMKWLGRGRELDDEA